MPRGADTKREREYEELTSEFKDEGRYKGREEEVAARIVNKQRQEFGETKGEKARDKTGSSPDRDLPIANYDQLTVDEVVARLGRLSSQEKRQIEHYEQRHKNRKTLMEALEQKH